MRAASVLVAALTLLAAVARADPAPRLADLAWMAGTWSAWQDGAHVEEHWMEPRGTVLVGMNRAVREDRTSFEYLRIEARADGLVLVAQPAGHSPVEFPMVRLHGEEAVFENPAHDFPQRVAYWIDEHGGLAARIEGAGPDGAPRAMEWHLRRSR